MTEVLWLSWLYVVGALISTVLVPQRTRVTGAIASLAVPVGLAGYAVVSCVFLVVGVDFSPLRVGMTVTAAVTALALARRDRLRLPGGDVALLSAALIAVGAASFAFQGLHLTRMTSDSFRYIEFASLLNQTGKLPEPDFLLRKRAVFNALMHTFADSSGDLYVESITPILALSGLAFFLWAGRRGLQLVQCPRPWAVALLTSATIALLLTNRAVYHAFYINGHMAFAIYALIFVAASWFAVIRQESWWIKFALVAMVAMLLLRPEAPLVVALFVVPLLCIPGVRDRTRTQVVVTFGAVAGLWYVVALGGRLGVVESPVAGAVVAAIALVAMLAARRRLPDHVMRRIPALTVAAALLSLLSLGLMAPDILGESVAATIDNLTGAGHWGVTWLVLPALLAVALLPAVRRRLEAATIWVVPIASFAPLVAVMAIGRDAAYRVGTGDSANRMLMHILLVATLYVVLTAGAVAGGARRERTSVSSRSSNGHILRGRGGRPTEPIAAADGRANLTQLREEGE